MMESLKVESKCRIEAWSGSNGLYYAPYRHWSILKRQGVNVEKG